MSKEVTSQPLHGMEWGCCFNSGDSIHGETAFFQLLFALDVRCSDDGNRLPHKTPRFLIEACPGDLVGKGVGHCPKLWVFRSPLRELQTDSWTCPSTFQTSSVIFPNVRDRNSVESKGLHVQKKHLPHPLQSRSFLSPFTYPKDLPNTIKKF